MSVKIVIEIQETGKESQRYDRDDAIILGKKLDQRLIGLMDDFDLPDSTYTLTVDLNDQPVFRATENKNEEM